ncbi:hypothetical protein PAXINDRAFT_13085 [Paxillus involutus ATCC 200175]|uniref:Uncharacterized protein n=1 Tax=Paxillus involutus ATCC 200175 TaxID=664439 RepID=A0A0C9TF32_PAXIN|nr:hypothetical protein PAXINDRAFT_13085 [Paxillus involutus ATCC 200175]
MARKRPKRPIYSPSGSRATQTLQLQPKQPTDDPNDRLTAPTTRLHRKRPTYDQNASSVTSTQGVDSRAAPQAWPPQQHRRTAWVYSETKRRGGREKGADDVPTTSTRHQPSPTSTPNTVRRRKASTAQCASRVQPPQPSTHSTNMWRDEEAREGGKGKGDDEKQRAHHVHETAAQPHVHTKRCTLTPGVDSPVCTTSAATPAINAQHEYTEDEETREGGKGKGNEWKRGREGRTRETKHRRAADSRQQTTGGRRRAQHVHETAAQPHVHAKYRTSTLGVDSPVCTASAATPAIDAQHEHTERRRGEGRKDTLWADDTSDTVADAHLVDCIRRHLPSPERSEITDLWLQHYNTITQRPDLWDLFHIYLCYDICLRVHYVNPKNSLNPAVWQEAVWRQTIDAYRTSTQHLLPGMTGITPPAQKPSTASAPSLVPLPSLNTGSSSTGHTRPSSSTYSTQPAGGPSAPRQLAPSGSGAPSSAQRPFHCIFCGANSCRRRACGLTTTGFISFTNGVWQTPQGEQVCSSSLPSVGRNN